MKSPAESVTTSAKQPIAFIWVALYHILRTNVYNECNAAEIPAVCHNNVHPKKREHGHAGTVAEGLAQRKATGSEAFAGGMETDARKLALYAVEHAP